MAQAVGVCGPCLRERAAAGEQAQAFRAELRRTFSLPPAVPRTGSATCSRCINACAPNVGQPGFCGVRRATEDDFAGGDRQANVSWYLDALPTNCVGAWVCAGGTGAGYPRFALTEGPEFGHHNLAVFYRACSFDCLFCQNWHFRTEARARANVSTEKLAAQAEATVSCICYFGGDPTPQIRHSIETARGARRARRGEVLRICWETNGSMSSADLNEMIDLALESGGCIKFDLKAADDRLHRALTGVTNRRTLSNFARLARRAAERPDPPLAIASTLLVPGYVDASEVRAIAAEIAALDPETPYALLAFYPDFAMGDLPTTSRAEAEEALAAARDAGLRRVRVGNQHLLR